MTKIPGQRSPSAEKMSVAFASRLTSMRARSGSRVHRRDRLQVSVPTLDEAILSEGCREQTEG